MEAGRYANNRTVRHHALTQQSDQGLPTRQLTLYHHTFELAPYPTGSCVVPETSLAATNFSTLHHSTIKYTLIFKMDRASTLHTLSTLHKKNYRTDITILRFSLATLQPSWYFSGWHKHDQDHFCPWCL